MTPRTAQLKEEVNASLELMCTLGDEMSARLQLACMDAKIEWSELEPQLADVDRAAQRLTEATRTAVSETMTRLSNLCSKLGRKKPDPQLAC